MTEETKTATKDEEEVVLLDKAGYEEETQASSMRMATKEPEPEEEETETGKYQLLERLFKFVKTRDTPINPVLAGYFAKLVTLLINRK